jgi:hypothetical protein
MRPGQGDIAIDMAFVKLIEQDSRYPVEVRRGQQAAQQDALGHVAYPGRWRGLALRVAPGSPPLTPKHSHALQPHGPTAARRQPARLQHHDFTVSEHATIEQYLRHLRGLPRARRSGEDETRLGRTRRNEIISKSIDG